MSRQRSESTSQAASRRWKSRIRRFLLTFFFLQLIVVGTGLYYTDNLNFIFPKKNTNQHVKTTETNKSIEGKDSVKVDLKETLPSVTTPSPSQMNRTSENTKKNQTEDDILAIKNINTPLEIAEKYEEKTTKTSFPESHKQQTISVIPQNAEYAPPVKSSPEAISEEKTDQHVYTVQDKDNLGLISMKVYGTTTKWRVIANANMAQLENNPNKIQPGMVLIIPPKRD
jgi:hypothetical protein